MHIYLEQISENNQFYAVTVGNITEENVNEYILKQAEESKKEERLA